MLGSYGVLRRVGQVAALSFAISVHQYYGVLNTLKRKRSDAVLGRRQRTAAAQRRKLWPLGLAVAAGGGLAYSSCYDRLRRARQSTAPQQQQQQPAFGGGRASRRGWQAGEPRFLPFASLYHPRWRAGGGRVTIRSVWEGSLFPGCISETRQACPQIPTPYRPAGARYGV